MSTELPAAAHPAQVAFYNDPKVRSIVYQLALCAAVAFLIYGAASNAIENLARAHIASGFGFLGQHGRLRYQPDADRIFVARLDLWPRVLGRIAQHVAGGRVRHRLCDHPRLYHRHRAAVAATGWWRKLPAATSKSSAICRCCCNCCSGTTRCSRRCRIFATASPSAGASSQQSRPVFAGAGF